MRIAALITMHCFSAASAHVRMALEALSTADGYQRKLEVKWGKVHKRNRCGLVMRTECAAFEVLDRIFAS